MAQVELPATVQTRYEARDFIPATRIVVGEYIPRRVWKRPVATGVTFGLELEGGRVKWTTIEAPQQVDALIQALLRHKRRVWPEAG